MDRLERKRAQVADAVTQVRQGQRAGLVVGHIMTPAPSCISPETSALELVRLFHAKQFRHLLVTDQQGKLLGVISDRDVLRCFGPSGSPHKDLLDSIPAGQLMSTDVVTIGPQDAITRAVKLMVEQGISSLPVLADGLLVGIITNTDLHIVLQLMIEASSFSLPLQSFDYCRVQPPQTA
jgi:acetoin utilization protein AcuB